MYCGKSTGYFDVLVNAIKPLLIANSLSNAIHYHIHDGSSYHTPHNHGLQLGQDLSCLNDPNIFTREVEMEYI